MAPAVGDNHQMTLNQISDLRTPDIGITKPAIARQRVIARAIGGVIHLDAVNRGHARADCSRHRRVSEDDHPSVFGKDGSGEQGKGRRQKQTHANSPDI